MSDDWRQDRIGSALRGENPTVLRRLPSGFAVAGDVQFLPGYCVLLTDRPDAQRLTDLPRADRDGFLSSLDALAEAVELACMDADNAFRRVNIEVHGNQDPFLHAHIWPRYDWEPADHITRPVALYPVDRWRDPATALGEQHQDLMAAIVGHLARLLP